MGKKQIVIRPEEQKPSHEVFSKKTINGKHLLKDEFYEREFRKLEIELVKFQNWVKKTNQKIVIIMEGRDGAGKGGTIKALTSHLNPRGCRIVALNKPSEREKTEWYFKRYISNLPSGGEIVFFDKEKIANVENIFVKSDFVKEIVGVHAVSEPCVFLASNKKGKFLEKKFIYDGVTVSIFEEDNLDEQKR